MCPEEAGLKDKKKKKGAGRGKPCPSQARREKRCTPALIVPLRLFCLFVCLNMTLSTDPALRLLFVNKVLLAHSHAHLLYVLSMAALPISAE